MVGGRVEGDVLGPTECILEGDALGASDGTLLGVNDGHNPHVALHVWKTPFSAHLLSFFIFLQFVVAMACCKKNVAFESEQGSHVPHVAGQCVSTLSNAHLSFVS